MVSTQARVIAVGYSNGANIAANVLLHHPGVLAGAVLFHAMVPSVPEQLPDLSGVPMFMGAGQRDPLIPPQQTERLALLLKQSGAEVTLHWEPGGHALSQRRGGGCANVAPDALSGGLTGIFYSYCCQFSPDEAKNRQQKMVTYRSAEG